VITEASARRLEALVASAAARGARVLLGGTREGAVFEPTVLGDVPRDCDVVACEAFGPIASIVRVGGLDDAIEQANATPYGLSSGVVTESLTSALRAVQGIRAGTVNVNEVPGYRLETSPFGGVKDSGLGVKEGVVEAVRAMTWVKTFSLPW
jgi:acyl-CoA reductase-like NAD-dependent aldehyde dehydrogenase